MGTKENRYLHRPTDPEFNVKLTELDDVSFGWYERWLMISYEYQLITILEELGVSWFVSLLNSLKQNPRSIQELVKETVKEYEKWLRP